MYFNDNRGGAGTPSTDINTPLSNTTPENFLTGSNPPWMTYQATGGGGVLSNGLYNTAFAQITYDLDENSGVSGGYQKIQTDTYRNFIPDGTGAITVSANINGKFDWQVDNFDWNQTPPSEKAYSGYRVAATIDVFTFNINTGALVANSDQLLLDNDTLSGSFQLSKVDENHFYVLHSQLVLETYLQNVVFTATGAIEVQPLTDEIFRIGNSEGDPLKMMATVEQTPVPIPPAIVLLAFGLGGLGVIRHRRHQEG
jgi:hypothetical protein